MLSHHNYTSGIAHLSGLSYRSVLLSGHKLANTMLQRPNKDSLMLRVFDDAFQVTDIFGFIKEVREFEIIKSLKPLFVFEVKGNTSLIFGKIGVVKVIGEHVGGEWGFETFFHDMLKVDVFHPRVIQDLFYGVVSMFDLFL